mmetsp:Transcript_23661/g.65688  ORF Transcript_23661/g.65688 Transcript_23661/m.65688 type:complete len:304 (-) Transcript_23661:53-964(-)
MSPPGERLALLPHSVSSQFDSTEGDKAVDSSARLAFESANADASRRYHQKRVRPSPEHDSEEPWHQHAGGLLQPVIFGGLDGILTSFAIVAGAAGGGLSITAVLVLGFSNIFADALSMGVGEFLSSKANNEWILSERKREEWEMENYREGEIQEMIDIYIEKGLSPEDAKVVIETMAKYEDFFVDTMMQQELELQVPEDDHVEQSMKEGFVMFCSFAFFGTAPLLGYTLIPWLFPHLEREVLFRAACLVTGLVLFFLGSIKSNFSRTNWFWSGCETLILGGTCATVAYTIGYFVNQLLDEEGV